MLKKQAWSLLPAILFLSFMPAGYASSLAQGNYSVEYANMTINSTAAYVQMINESAYLIFTPNLTSAYKYLDMARQVYTAQPDLAVLYAGKAHDAAAEAYNNISSYREDSLIAVAVLTAITAVALYKLGMPVRKARRAS